MRRFSKGPNTLFEYRPGMPLADIGGIFTGPAGRSYIDVNGVVRYTALNEPRDNYWINGKRCFVREEPSTNLKFSSENLGINWSIRGAGSFNLDTSVAPDGLTSFDTFNPGAAFGYAGSETHGVDANGRTFSISAWFKKKTPGSMLINWGILKNGDAGCGLNTQSTITEVPQRLTFTGTGNVTTTAFYSYFQEASGGTASFEVWGWQVEEKSFVSSYIKTPGQAAVTRTAEQLSFAWSAVPQVMTGLFTGVCLAAPAASTRLFQLSSAHDINEPRFLVYFPTAPGTLYHQNAVPTAVTVAPANNINPGDSFEFRNVLRADGSILASKTLNGGAEVSAGPSAANALASVWGTAAFSPPRLYVGTDGATAEGANWAITSIRFVVGEQTLDYMRYDFLNAITSDRAEFVHLLEFQFASGTVRLTTGAQDLSWGGFQWEAVGGLLEMGGVEETSDSRAQGVDVKLSGVDQTVLAVLLTSQYRGRTVTIWRAHLDDTTGQFVGDPLLLFQGLQLSPYTVDEERSRTAGTVRISTRLSGYFGVERVRGIMTNLVSHQHYFSDIDAAKTAVTDAWDQQVYSQQSFVNGAYAQIEAPTKPTEVIFGLNDDPFASASWTDINYSMNLQGLPAGFTVTIYENGVSQGAPTTWSPGDIFAILYANGLVSYFKNGALLRSVATPTGQTFYFDSTFFGGTGGANYGIAKLKNIRFGPSVAWNRASFVASSGVILTSSPDLFFQHSASLANVKVYWGTPVPMSPGSNSGGPPKTCFPAGTKVLLSDLTERSIEDVELGQLVASFDEKDGSPVVGRVLGRMQHLADTLLEVTVGGRVLRVTPEHRIYVGDGAFVPAGELCVGNKIWCVTGLVVVSKIETLPREEIVVYNLEVTHHTYVANGVAVHNMKAEPGQ
jgi:hypothetical protein